MHFLKFSRKKFGPISFVLILYFSSSFLILLHQKIFCLIDFFTNFESFNEKLKSENFIHNAPEEIIDEQKNRYKDYVLSMEKIEIAIKLWLSSEIGFKAI